MAIGRHAHSYEQAVGDAIAFAGQEHEFFLEAKAEYLVALAARRLGDPHRLRALDVGCGPGLMHRHLGAFGELRGADPEEAMIARARAENPSVEYHVAAGSALPFADGELDLAFAVSVFHHIAPAARRAAAREMARVVRPGGLVAIVEHNPLNPLTRLVVRRCAFDEDVELVGRRESVALLSFAGARAIEVAYILFFPWRGMTSVERRLRGLPLGAQYVAAGQRI